MLAFAGALACSATSVVAQTVDPAPPSTLSLTPEERAELMDHGTEETVDAARRGPADGVPAGGGPGRAIHGELDAMIGTHGARGIAGTAAIPLGDHAGAVFSFEQSRYGDPR